MNIKILFDREGIGGKFSIGWGISCLVNEVILFDTGEESSYLFNNMSTMGIEKSQLKAVVISHDHWDHTGGLWALLENSHGLKVYACPSFSQTFKDRVKSLHGKLINVISLKEVIDNIYCSGEIGSRYNGEYIGEQAIVIKTNKGISIITGCAHPGIINILINIRKFFPSEKIYMVIGGFHLEERDKRDIHLIIEKFKELEVVKVGPSHCSGTEAEKLFQEAYKENFIDIKVGEIIEV